MCGKLKVAMVCHFSNAKVREKLHLDNRKLYKFVRHLLRMPTKEDCYGDIAGWDTYMIELLRQREDIELYVISAHSGLTRRVTSFDMDGVNYSFVRIEGATLLKRLIVSPSLWHRLNPVRPLVRRIVTRIQPDLIALIGAENAHISGTVLGIKNIPLIVKCQTIYNNPERVKLGPIDAKNAYVERLIFKDLQYVSVGAGMHGRLFRQMNKKAFNFRWPFGNMLPTVKPLEKEYDFVNFAMAMNDKKGYPDAIQALAIVRTKHPDVRLNLVGGVSTDYKMELQGMIDSLGVSDNVIFTPFFARQEDLFQHLQRSRFALLPCKMDSVSSTIRQAMHYELPVVCYKTTGTPKLNQEKECVLIVDNGNVEALAANMLILLDDKERADELRCNAKEYSRRWDDDEGTLRQMVSNFYAVVDNYRNGTPIPKELLYNENF